MPTLTLYHMDYCPYCRLVRTEASKLGIPLTLVDIDEQPSARAMLQRQRGRTTVPVLRIQDGKKDRLMPESRDIVRYLNTLAPPKKKRSVKRRRRNA